MDRASKTQTIGERRLTMHHGDTQPSPTDGILNVKHL